MAIEMPLCIPSPASRDLPQKIVISHQTGATLSRPGSNYGTSPSHKAKGPFETVSPGPDLNDKSQRASAAIPDLPEEASPILISSHERAADLAEALRGSHHKSFSELGVMKYLLAVGAGSR